MGEMDCQEKNRKPSVLKRLRQKLVVVNPTTDDEKRQMMNLILEHRSEFPLNLREAISEAVSETPTIEIQPDDFLSGLFGAVEAYFFGQRRDIDDDDDENEEEPDSESSPLHWWHGPNSDIDTDEEVELAIRFFPEILTRKLHTSPLSSLNDCYPIYMLLMCSKALCFIPLLAELGRELGKFEEEERYGLTCFMKNIIVHLVAQDISRDDPDQEHLDETIASILTRLKEKGFIHSSDIYNHELVFMLLNRSRRYKKLRTKRRLRFLINLDPSILVECGRGFGLLRLYLSMICYAAINDARTRCDALQKYEMMIELGMAHYPKELGFLFHQLSYRLACDIFGGETIAEIAETALAKYQSQNNNNNSSSSSETKHTLQNLLFAAATNDKISLEGLYTLVRRDPIALMLQTSSGK